MVLRFVSVVCIASLLARAIIVLSYLDTSLSREIYSEEFLIFLYYFCFEIVSLASVSLFYRAELIHDSSSGDREMLSDNREEEVENWESVPLTSSHNFN